jgi:NAD(P)-dependent dehydrogenase (short-subunit alcohol dehydrogenase family)
VTGKLAVVTGGASGIGEATARRFARCGFAVVICDIQIERAEAVAAEIRSAHGTCDVHQLDVAIEAQVNTVAEKVYERHRRVDVVVNAGGILENAIRVVDMAVAEFDELWRVNVRGTFLVSRAFAGRMCNAGSGAIVNLCSLTSYRPSPHPGYGAGKAALMMLTEIMAAEFGPRGVRVNAVAPGYTLTPAMKARIDSGQRDPAAVIAKSALRRFVETSEVADAIFFLCSNDASAITGVTLPIDCGWLAYSAYDAYASQPSTR